MRPVARNRAVPPKGIIDRRPFIQGVRDGWPAVLSIESLEDRYLERNTLADKHEAQGQPNAPRTSVVATCGSLVSWCSVKLLGHIFAKCAVALPEENVE
jgi:hypothetical protein